MRDSNKTRAELLSELAGLRQRVAELEALDKERMATDQTQRQLLQQAGQKIGSPRTPTPGRGGGLPRHGSILDPDELIHQVVDLTASGLVCTMLACSW